MAEDETSCEVPPPPPSQDQIERQLLMKRPEENRELLLTSRELAKAQGFSDVNERGNREKILQILPQINQFCQGLKSRQ
jgi:hypothetical protein